jgi:hypothetical protein
MAQTIYCENEHDDGGRPAAVMLTNIGAGETSRYCFECFRDFVVGLAAEFTSAQNASEPAGGSVAADEPAAPPAATQPPETGESDDVADSYTGGRRETLVTDAGDQPPATPIDAEPAATFPDEPAETPAATPPAATAGDERRVRRSHARRASSN